MQTERVTFLTTSDHKAALDAFAATNGRSVGHVVREATSRYLAETEEDKAFAEALAIIGPDFEAAMAKWNQRVDSMEASLDAAHEAVREALAAADATRR